MLMTLTLANFPYMIKNQGNYSSTCVARQLSYANN